MKYLSKESAIILNIGLVGDDIINQVKKELIKGGWIFTTEEAYENGEFVTRYKIQDIDGNMFMDVQAVSVKEVLEHIQRHYTELKLFKDL